MTRTRTWICRVNFSLRNRLLDFCFFELFYTFNNIFWLDFRMFFQQQVLLLRPRLSPSSSSKRTPMAENGVLALGDPTIGLSKAKVSNCRKENKVRRSQFSRMEK